MTADTPAGRRGYFLNALMLGLTLALIVGGVELYVRFVEDDGMQFDLEMWKYAKSVKRISENPRIGHEHRPLSTPERNCIGGPEQNCITTGLALR